MNVLKCMITALMVSVVAACTSDEGGDNSEPSAASQPRLEMEHASAERGKPHVCVSQNPGCHQWEAFSEGVMRTSVNTATTVRAARSLIGKMVDGILAIDNVGKRKEKMKLLAQIVAERPVNTSTMSNRSFSHEMRFAMGMEIFDGFIKLGDMDGAWVELLSLLKRYQEALAEARAELDKMLGESSRLPKETASNELRNAQAYFRSVNNGYGAAKEYVRKFVLPHVTEKHKMSEAVKEKVMWFLDLESSDSRP